MCYSRNQGRLLIYYIAYTYSYYRGSRLFKPATIVFATTVHLHMCAYRLKLLDVLDVILKDLQSNNGGLYLIIHGAIEVINLGTIVRIYHASLGK